MQSEIVWNLFTLEVENLVQNPCTEIMSTLWRAVSDAPKDIMRGAVFSLSESTFAIVTETSSIRRQTGVYKYSVITKEWTLWIPFNDKNLRLESVGACFNAETNRLYIGSVNRTLIIDTKTKQFHK